MDFQIFLLSLVAHKGPADFSCIVVLFFLSGTVAFQASHVPHTVLHGSTLMAVWHSFCPIAFVGTVHFLVSIFTFCSMSVHSMYS